MTAAEPLSRCAACGHLRHHLRPCWTCVLFAARDARIDGAVLAEAQRQAAARHRALVTHWREAQ